MPETSSNTSSSSSRNEWNYHPEFPIDNNPLFAWPPRPMDTLKYYRDSWLVASEATVFLLMAWLTYTYASPTLATTAQLDWDWGLGIYVRNFLVVGIFTGGLHYYFFSKKAQALELKYTPQFLSRGGSRFLFNNQLYDNVFYTMVSGVAVWSAYEVMLFWAMAQGHISSITFAEYPVWTIAALPLVSMWISFHFYLVHRLLHFKPFYDRFHALHHRNVNVGPFSGISMHPVEHLLYFSSLLIHFVLPTHPMHIIFHFYMLGLSAIVGHTGFDALLIKNKRRIALGHFHHQLHHRYFECNYGAVDMPWYVLIGTFHDGTPEARKKMNKRIRKRQQ